MSTPTDLEAAPQRLSEEGAIGYLRQLAQLSQDNYRTEGWAYPTQYHLLLQHGRRFRPAPLPDHVAPMPNRQCYMNAARYAEDHPEEQLLYAEGFARMRRMDLDPTHAWCVRPDGTVLDPIWDTAPGRARVGIVLKDPTLWLLDGGGILSDMDRTLPLLGDGLPAGALALLGQPV
ncbi:hypothetical protein [Streptomyces sp. NPDC059788]|uniref:hypothetical protein n=1 Tax=Streptomyces sp. NPDC059788 TaxID=3346948 RepID=UPI003658342D